MKRTFLHLILTLLMAAGFISIAIAATRNAADQIYSNEADGFKLGGGATERTLTVSGGNITLTGNADGFIYTFPGTATTLVGTDTTQTLTNKTWAGVTIDVIYGGTGTTTLTGIVKGNGTGALTALIGTPSYVTRWSDSNTLGIGALYDNGTNVGIGSVNPGAALDVGSGTHTYATGPGEVYIQNDLEVGGGAYAGAGFFVGTTKVTDGVIGSTASSSSLALIGYGEGVKFLTWTGTAAAEKVRISSTGNMGIGTNAPKGLLQVDSNPYDTTPFIVTTDLNVGVGTVRPQAKLEVGTATAYLPGSDPSVLVDNNLYVDGTVYGTTFYGNGAGLTGVSSISDLNAGYIPMASSSTAIVDSGIYQNGTNIGINTTVPLAGLEVIKSSTDPLLKLSSSVSGDGDYVVVNSAGCVGIGVSSPDYLLHVSGNFHASDVGGSVLHTKTIQMDNSNLLLGFGGSAPFAGNTLVLNPINEGTRPSNSWGIEFISAYESSGAAFSTIPVYNYQTSTVDGESHAGLLIDTVPSASSSKALLMMGAATNFDFGNTHTGFYGAADGTYFGIYAPHHFGGDYIRFSGDDLPNAFSVDFRGVVTAGGFSGSGSGLTGVPGTISELTAFYIPRASSSTTLANSIIYDSSVNIGISSTSPKAKLEIKKTTTGPAFKITNSTSGDYLIFTSTGNMGIGSAVPGSMLHVGAGTVLPNSIVSIFSNVNSYSQVNHQNRSNGNAASTDFIATANDGTDAANYIDMGINGSGYTAGVVGTAHDAYLYSVNTDKNIYIGAGSTGQNVVFFNGGTTMATSERMRITSTGNVGIGATVPQALLEVKGGAVYINTTPSVLIMKSPDGTCASCGIDNADAWSCSPISCP